MLKCSECSRDLEEKDALVHTTEDGQRKVICPECFERLTGVDYKTFAYRKENAKQTMFAVLFCLAATAYAWYDKGWLWGAGGIVLTILVYLFSSKPR
jgi:hypothetical protein